MNPIRIALFIFATILLTACAHPISITPKLENIGSPQSPNTKNSAKVGYFVSQSALATEITTPGGGGDNVRYFPYRDVDSSLQFILANSFTDVSRLANPFDLAEIKSKGIDFIISPEIVTTSGGSGLFTWPPTSFTFDLSSTIKNSQGQSIKTIRVVGTGTAETGERLSEHGLAGRRAAEDALKKFQASLIDFQAVPTKVMPATQSIPNAARASVSIETRLKELKELFDKGLISKEDLDLKRKQILESM